MITLPATCDAGGSSEEVLAVDPVMLARHAPATHLIVRRNSILVGRCSLWTGDTPRLDGSPVGVLGHYAAADATAGVAVLDRACDELRAQGFGVAIGPMDGSTWRRYRLLTRRGDEPPFFLEPDNPDDWPNHFLAAGFKPLANYTSSLNTDLALTDPRVPEAQRRLAADGVQLRTIDVRRYEQELAAVHALSVEAFAKNFLYTPIGREEFLALYLPLRDVIRPELVLLAERAGELIGFLFGISDMLEPRTGRPLRTALAKSMAVRPGRSGAGLGSVLMDEFQQAARRAGFTRVIHALMHQTNASARIAERFGKTMRQYTLYSKSLTDEPMA